jgi:hypothetical protein
MKTIGDYDPFFDFDFFETFGVGAEKKETISKLLAIFDREIIFLKYWKKPEQPSTKERREQRPNVALKK